MLRKEGDDSLLKRVQNFRMTGVDEKTVDTADRTLCTCDQLVVAKESDIGAKLYGWVC